MESNREKMVSEHKVSETFGGYIRQITFNNGETIKINKNDIVELSVLIMLEKVNH